MNLLDNTGQWLKKYNRPLVIAGPCSAESEKQMLETAARMRASGSEVSVFRAGIWKPRTKPNGFEGVGTVGLPWLQKVKQEFGFETATEVATAHHVEAALAADVDILWIGARSTVNPFTVQEIATALQGTEKTILVKNPVNPDLALWIGALERLAAQDVRNLGVIHRGFSTYQKTRYRNSPNWQLAIDFKNQFPNIPILIDPSHICGNRTDLADVAQQGLNIGYDGIMIEAHPNPDDAWSDARQQITPERLQEILSGLVLRNSACSEYDEEMQLHRTTISDLDYQLVEILTQRMGAAEHIGALKKKHNLTVFQPERWREVADFAEQKAEENGLSQEFVLKLFKAIHEASIDVQNKIMTDKS